jgi:hypothetical protein
MLLYMCLHTQWLLHGCSVKTPAFALVAAVAGMS